MPLFQITQDHLEPVEQTNFPLEKVLQKLVESSLEAVFDCRLVASEFWTSALQGGRIDTLALSEDGNPVIIEYKKDPSSKLINQSLYYLSWIDDHRGDVEKAVQKALGTKVQVDWSDARVICIAPNYKKWDVHAVQMMEANVELWTYRLFKNQTLYLEEVRQKSYSAPVQNLAGKNPVMVAAGKKAAITKVTSSYKFEQHVSDKSEAIRDLALAVQAFVLDLDPAIEEAPKKFYVAYKISQNLLCMVVQKQAVILYLKLDPGQAPGPPGISRDMSQIGHFGTGDLEVTLQTTADFESAKPFIKLAYEKVGG